MFGAIVRAYREAFAGLPRAVWLLSTVTLIHRSGTMVLPFLTLYLTTQRGMSVRSAGVYLALYGAGGVIGAMVGGRLAERLGNHRAMQITLFSAGVGFLALGVVDEPWLLALLLFATSVAAEGFRTPSSTALSLAVPPDLRARAFAHRRLAINLGMAIGTAAGGFLATMAYLWLFLVDGSTCLAAALAVTLWLEPGGHRETEGQKDESGPAAGKANERGRSLWRDPVFVAALGLSTLMNLAFVQLFGTYPLTLSLDFGYTEAVVGVMLALNTGLIVLFEMILIHRLERLRPLVVVAAGCLFLALGFVLVPWGHWLGLAVVAMVIMTVGEMLSHPVIEGFVANHVSPSALPRAMGLLTAGFATTVVIAPVIGTYVYDLWGQAVLWRASAVVGVVSAAGFLWLAARTKVA